MHEYSITVRGFHLDAYGHVNNARYLEYLEEARWEFFKVCHGALEKLQAMNIGLFLVRLEADFRSPALLDDVLSIYSEVVKVGSRSLVFHQKILNAQTGAVVLDGMLTGAVVDLLSQKSTPITEEMRPIFDALVTRAPGMPPEEKDRSLCDV